MLQPGTRLSQWIHQKCSSEDRAEYSDRDGGMCLGNEHSPFFGRNDSVTHSRFGKVYYTPDNKAYCQSVDCEKAVLSRKDPTKEGVIDYFWSLGQLEYQWFKIWRQGRTGVAGKLDMREED